MSAINSKISGWGMYVPERVVTNDELSKQVETSDQWIKERTGISERRIASAEDSCSGLAVSAAKIALAKARITPNDLDLIIVATSSPDHLTPPVSSQIQDLLGAPQTGAFTVVVGCTGFVSSLIIADQFIRTGSSRRVLVIGVELISRYVDWTDRNTCVLFGDGAGAIVMEASEGDCGILSQLMGSDGSGYKSLILPSGGTHLPPSKETLEQRLNYIKMDGTEVFKFATRTMGKALQQAIAKAGLTAEDIDLFIPHQANIRIIDAAAKHAGLSAEKVFVNVERYGNTSAASVPIALCEAFDSGRAKQGDTIALVAFGAGLSWAAAVMKL